jgi:hypothetical protein
MEALEARRAYEQPEYQLESWKCRSQIASSRQDGGFKTRRRVCCFGDTKCRRRRSSLSSLPPGYKGPAGPEEDISSPSQNDVVFEEQQGSDTGERVLHTSAVFPTLSKDSNDCYDAAVSSAEEEIVKLVVMYVLKACLTLADMLDRNRSKNMIVVHPKMPCRV